MRFILMLLFVSIAGACESPESATGTGSSDTMILDPGKSKVETDTTMHRDTISNRTDSVR